ncbi:MAG TPA: hypothetical protein VEF05_15425 [Terriglobales bacterium]|nr:hypothetical protein [Terriglobales bacterium]
MPTLTIQRVETVNQYGENVVLFDPHNDALSLKMFVLASDDLLITGSEEENESVSAGFQAVFQIIDALTNDVILNEVWESGFLWGRSFWISMGNNWGPTQNDYTTPERWGLATNKRGSGIFGFRGIIRQLQELEATFVVTSDAFGISDIRWFGLDTFPFDSPAVGTF